jgi:hypothetical protein
MKYAPAIFGGHQIPRRLLYLLDQPSIAHVTVIGQLQQATLGNLFMSIRLRTPMMMMFLGHVLGKDGR